MNPSMMGGKGGPMAMMGGKGPAGGQAPMGGGMPGQMPGGMMPRPGMPAQGQMPPQQPMQQQQQQQQQQPTGGNALTAAGLAAAPPAVQKQMIGEKIYPLIAKFQPELAGRITGMMLEMDNSELLILLESGPQLKNKVDEAIRVIEGR